MLNISSHSERYEFRRRHRKLPSDDRLHARVVLNRSQVIVHKRFIEFQLSTLASYCQFDNNMLFSTFVAASIRRSCKYLWNRHKVLHQRLVSLSKTCIRFSTRISQFSGQQRPIARQASRPLYVAGASKSTKNNYSSCNTKILI